MNRKFFGTDGVRGPYGGPVINEDFATRLGHAVALWLRNEGERRRVVGGTPQPAMDRRNNAGIGRVLIGRDTRASGLSLEAAIARGLHAQGAEPVSLGVLPTPAVARAVRMTGARLGVVITASHNPAVDNGIKFFGHGGVKLTDAEEAQIEVHLVSGTTLGGPQIEARAGAIDDYVSAAQSVLAPGALAGWRVVLDTANGATCATSPAALRNLGANVIGIGNAPDGKNINAGVGSEHPEKMCAAVREHRAMLGIAHDGDGDRCVLCDETGAVLDGDEILTILATHALAHGALENKTLVVTVQSNLGVDAAVGAAGGRVVRSAVGDRYVSELMQAEGAKLGGESSGHVICAEVSPVGDGLVAALKVIQVMRVTGKPLSELRQVLKKFPQLTAALAVREKRPLDTLPGLSAAIRALETSLGARGRVLVRYSGTEPKLRLLVEGPDEATTRAGLANLEAAVRAELTVV